MVWILCSNKILFKVIVQLEHQVFKTGKVIRGCSLNPANISESFYIFIICLFSPFSSHIVSCLFENNENKMRNNTSFPRHIKLIVSKLWY